MNVKCEMVRRSTSIGRYHTNKETGTVHYEIDNFGLKKLAIEVMEKEVTCKPGLLFSGCLLVDMGFPLFLLACIEV